MKKLLLTFMLGTLAIANAAESRSLMVLVGYQGDSYHIETVRTVNQQLDSDFSTTFIEQGLQVTFTSDQGDTLLSGYLPNPRAARAPLESGDTDEDHEEHQEFELSSGVFMVRLPYVDGIRYITIAPATLSTRSTSDRNAASPAFQLDLQPFIDN